MPTVDDQGVHRQYPLEWEIDDLKWQIAVLAAKLGYRFEALPPSENGRRAYQLVRDV